MNKLSAVLVAVLPTFLKLIVLKAAGAKVGKNVRIGFGALILCKDIELSDDTVVGGFSLIRADRFFMGQRSRIGRLTRCTVNSLTLKSQSVIDSQVVVSGDQSDPRSSLYLGPASWIFPYCFLDAARSIRLGRNVGVGGSTYLFTHGRWLSKLDGFPVAFGDVTIGDDVWIPWRCFIMPGVDIGSRTVIAACSVITKNVPDEALVAGAPAKVVRDKASKDLTWGQRLDVLREISSSFAEKKGLPFRFEPSGDTESHFVGSQKVLNVTPQVSSIDHAGAVFNIVGSELDPMLALNSPMWSLNDHRSSPLPVLSGTAKAWLEHARLFGVRFYPMDEDLS